MSFWTGSSKIHELYTAACGLYVCWLSIRGVTVLLAWMPQGRTVIVHKVQEWTLMVGFSEQPPKKKKRLCANSGSFYLLLFVQILKTLVVALLVAGVIPLLLGLLFELVIVAPLRVPLDQTPLFYPWQVLLDVGSSFGMLVIVVAFYFNKFTHFQDWALGVLHAKIIAAITLMGPQWWLKTVIEQVGF